jgi:hypothetical protein
MADWDDERGRRTSVLGRVDWACWLAVLGLAFLTVIGFLVRFAALSIVMIVFAVLLVAFDSWVNRPGGIRGRRAARQGESGSIDAVPMPPRREPERSRQRDRQPPRQPARQPNRPAPNYQANRQGQPTQQRRGQPPRSNGQPGRPRQGQQQPTRAANPAQQPYRQGAPQPTPGRDPGYRARA